MALAQINPDPWLSPIDRESISEGEKHFQAASNLGLFKNGDALSKLAWFEYLSGNAEQSVELLGQAADHQKDGGQAKAPESLLSRRNSEPFGPLRPGAGEPRRSAGGAEDLILARQEKGESLWMLGRKEEAIAAWTDAVQRNANLALANNQLAGAKRSLGRFEEAAAHEQQADQFTPDIRFIIGCSASG